MTVHNFLDAYNIEVFQGKHRVFENLHLIIRQHENVAILWPNGSGKSTLLKLLSRELYPVVKDNSYIKINGSETIEVKALRETIGIVSHDLQTNYPGNTTGLDVVISGFFGATSMIYSHYEITDKQIIQAQKAIEALGLSSLENRRYNQMSTGQQRCFLLARAIIHKPATLILDEPTSGLDIHHAFRLIKHLRNLSLQGASIILATHHVQEIIPEINRVILINEGRIIADGEKQSILNKNNLSRLYSTDVEVVEKEGFYQIFPI